MALKDRVLRRVVGQFHRPHGMGGHLVGWVMAHRSSNRERNRWVVSLLNVQPADRVLEIGFGPGIATTELSRLASRGQIFGIDHSQVMLRQASKRNSVAVRAGRVDLRLGRAELLPDFGAPLDKILAVNSVGFWPGPVARLTELRSMLRPGGEAGFPETRVETLDLDPPVVCVLASR
jgi:ubiquinone/menaquinone biosynthesis C-methylase UbiE